jgi:hypothetical protein
VLTAHLIENEQRGEMSFWDKATGIVALKRRLEAEQGRPLTLRPLEDGLHAVGLAVNTATLGLYLFATDRLRTLGEAVVGLAGLDVKTLQPRLNAIKRYAMARQSSSEDALYDQVFEPVFRRIAGQYPHTGEFSAAATCEACEAAMAAHLGETVDALREGLRPVSARGGQGEPSATRTDATATPSTAEVAPPENDELLQCARAFADVVGLGVCVQPAPMSAAGFQLAPLPDPDEAAPERQRAWTLLSEISGQVDHEMPAPASAASLGSTFLVWLVDPADASATAFWQLLACLRRTRRVIDSPDVESASTFSTEES